MILEALNKSYGNQAVSLEDIVSHMQTRAKGKESAD